MNKEIKIMMALNYFHTNDTYDVSELKELIGIDVSQLTALLKEAHERNWITYSNKPIVMYYDNTGTFDQDIDITSEGEDILEDDNYLAKLLLRELKTQLRNGTFKINVCYLPFLNGKQYMNLLRYIVSAGYVESTNSKPEIIHTSDGDFLNDHITLTDKGLYFMKNKNNNLHSSSVTNIGTQINTSGHSAIATGDNSSANLYHQENNGFESVDELIKYLSGLNEYEKPLIASVINDIHQQPENKDNILSKVESFLTNHPKLLTTLTSGTTLIFNNWDAISTSLGL